MVEYNKNYHNLVFMQEEDAMVTFEKEDGDTIIYPIVMVPKQYKEGDIIKSIIHLDWIEFIELDTEEMERRQANMRPKVIALRNRARRSTN